MPEIQKADLNARRKAILIVLVGAVIGSALVMTVQLNRSRIGTWLFAHRGYFLEHPEVVALFFFVLMFPVLASAAYQWRFAARTIAARRFPPPGAQVVRNTTVLSGETAVTRGRLLQALAGILALIGLLMPAAIWYILRGIAAAV
jgi:hypothetical protein